MEKAKRREKKWKYMLHDPRIGNPTYPRAARGEDKEDWKRVFNRYFQIRTHGPRGELKVNRIGSLSKRRVRLSKLITAGQRSRDTERNVNGCGSRMNEVDVASNCLIFHGEGEGYKNCRAT